MAMLPKVRTVVGLITIWSGCRVPNFILDSYSPFVMIRSSSEIRSKARLLAGLDKRFYEKVIKVKADVAALLYV